MELPAKTLRRLHDNTDGLLKAVIDQMNLAHHQVADENHPYLKEIDEYLTEVKFQLMKVRREMDYKAIQQATKIIKKERTQMTQPNQSNHKKG